MLRLGCCLPPLSKFLATCLNGANDKVEVCVLSNIYVLQYNSSNSFDSLLLSFVYISVRVIRHRLIHQFAQFVTSFYP